MLRTVLVSIILLTHCACFAQVYEVQKGIVRFYSEAPQEVIKATTESLKGAIDIRKKTFVFKVYNSSFMGFNSPLQREHFNENYLESERYPESYFTGKIIEDLDVSKDGDYKLRAKGKLKIHGIEQERIIDVKVKSAAGKLTVQSSFVISLSDYNIKIPKVVYDKLAPDIHITVAASLMPRNKP